MDERYLGPLNFSRTNDLHLYLNTGNRELEKHSNQASISVDEIRKRGLRYKYFFCDSGKRKKGDPSVFLLVGGGDGKYHRFTIKRENFIELFEICRLPGVFVQSIGCNNGSLGHFVAYSGKKSKSKPSSLSVVIATPYSPFQDFSVAVRIDVGKGNLIGIFFNKKETRIPQIIDMLEQHRKESLKAPLKIMGLIYEEYTLTVEDWRKDLDLEVVRIEQTTTMTSLAIAWVGPGLDATELEYEKLLRAIHACNTNLIFLENLINFEIEFGEFVYKLFDIFEDLRKRAGKLVFHKPQTKDEILNRLAFLLKLSHFRKQQTGALRERIQSQTNLLYSLVAQRDSKVNLSIALAAQEESRTMRTIGFLTLVFLPSSLVAAIFSTGIFNLSNQTTNGSGSAVAPLWWVFVLASLVFTSVVVLVWWVWYKRILRPPIHI